MVRKSIVIAMIASLAASSAQAALLTNIEGGVAVNAGAGYKSAATPVTLTPGERVRTTNGSADIVYDNGCTVHVAQNQVVLVANITPECNRPVSLKDNVVEEPGIPPEYIVGGLVVGGAIACGILCFQQTSP